MEGYPDILDVCISCLWSQGLNRAESGHWRGGVYVHMCTIEYAWVWANVCEVDYSRVVQHSGTSAAVTSLSCWERRVLSLPGNAWSQPKRSPLLSFPLFFLLRTSSPLPVNHTGGTAHCRAWLGMKIHKCAMTSRLFPSQRTWGDSVWLSWFLLIIFLWMPHKHPPTASLAPSRNTRATDAALKENTDYSQVGMVNEHEA